MITKRFLVLVCAFSLLSCYEMNKKLNKYFGAGSYVYAETYSFDISEQELLKIIKEFKIKKDYKVKLKAQAFQDVKDNHWYFIDFQINNKIYSTWTRQSSNGSTTFAFIGIFTSLSDLNEHGVPKNYYEINKDLPEEENEKELEEFESLIVEPLKERVEEYNKSKN